MTGFYSYGEISPYASGHCDSHNQTMTITVIRESEAALAARPSRSLAPDTPAIRISPRAWRRRLLPSRCRLLGHACVGAATVGEAAQTARPAPAAITAPPPSSARTPTPTAARVRPPVVTRIPPSSPGVAGPVLAREKRGDVLVVSVAGRLTESFRAEALGRELSGTVVLISANVERITSFGVREWLTMLGAAAGRANLFLARCPDAVVNQLAMIRSFAGAAQVASFFGLPLRGVRRAVAVRRRGRRRRAARQGPGSGDVPALRRQGSLRRRRQDVLRLRVAARGRPFPADVRAALDALAPPEGPKEAVEKTVEGDSTRVHLHRAAKQVRWQRIFDGIEGGSRLTSGAPTSTPRAPPRSSARCARSAPRSGRSASSGARAACSKRGAAESCRRSR